MAHTSAPGMLRRNAVRNGMGLPPRRTYTATCVDSNNPQAVQIARITHQRGYDECARRPDGIMNRLSSLTGGAHCRFGACCNEPEPPGHIRTRCRVVHHVDRAVVDDAGEGSLVW